MPEENEKIEALTRVAIPAIDAILGKPFKVLDDGFIRVIDYMGGDASVVQSARVSYGAGTKKLSEDKGLINYLMRHRHTTPFEMPEMRFHVRVPMDCWRQWIRHRTSSTNEYSTRYSIAIDEKQRTGKDKWRKQADKNKQGSGGYIADWPKNAEQIVPQYIDKELRAKLVAGTAGEYLTWREEVTQNFAKEVYEERVNTFDIAREQARKDLPLSTYTEAYWKCDLHNLLHFLGLRMESHAQEEIRDYAIQMGEIVRLWCPLTWDAFMNYRFNAMTFSANEQAVLQSLNEGDRDDVWALAKQFGWLELKKGCEDASVINPGVLKENRERIEFEKKRAQLSLKAPWSF